jgi:hypothetical protein
MNNPDNIGVEPPNHHLMRNFINGSLLVALVTPSLFAKDQIKLNVSSDPHPHVDAPIRMVVETQPQRPSRRYTYLIRWDDEDRWTVLAHRTRDFTHAWTPRRAGRMEIRVDAVADDAEEVRDTVKVEVRAEAAGARMHGRSSLVPGSFPAYDEPAKLVMEERSVVLGQTARVNIYLLEPRNSRRITVMDRHESDSEWRVFLQNPARLTFDWTPRRLGAYKLRVDVVGARDERSEINVVCVDPQATSGARQRGN